MHVCSKLEVAVHHRRSLRRQWILPHRAGGFEMLVGVQPKREQRWECCSMRQAPCLFALIMPLPEPGNARPSCRVQGTIPLKPLSLPPLHIATERLLVHEVLNHRELKLGKPVGREELLKRCDHRLLCPPHYGRSRQSRSLESGQCLLPSLGPSHNPSGWYTSRPWVWSWGVWTCSFEHQSGQNVCFTKFPFSAITYQSLPQEGVLLMPEVALDVVDVQWHNFIRSTIMTCHKRGLPTCSRQPVWVVPLPHVDGPSGQLPFTNQILHPPPTGDPRSLLRVWWLQAQQDGQWCHRPTAQWLWV